MSSPTVQMTVGDATGKEMWVTCGVCNRSTWHAVVTVLNVVDGNPDFDVVFWEDYFTLKCQGCRTVSFCIQSRSSDDPDVHPDTGEHIDPSTVVLFPSRIAGRPEMQSLHELPPGVRHIYRETHRALCNDQAILPGIGIRAIVEAICKDKNAAGANLAKQIDDLATKKVITDDAAKILHSLRFMGNDAAHETKSHTVDELAIALNVVEHLLQGVYVIPKQAAKLPKKRP